MSATSRPLALVITALLAINVGVVIVRGPGEGDERPGEARLRPEGTVLVNENVVEGEQLLRTGDRVRVQDGSALLTMAGDVSLGLRTGSEVVVDTTPQLVAGDLLVRSPDRDLGIDGGDTEVTVSRGAARLSNGLGFEIGVYRGQASLSSAGRSLPDGVQRLRQATVPAPGLVPSTPSPLALRDPWDQQFPEIADAVDLSDDLEAYSRGFTGQVRPGEATTVGYYKSVIRGLAGETGFSAGLYGAAVAARAPGETLVGASIVAAGRQGSFAERWNSVFGFRSQGAAWGLVALDQGVDRGPVLNDLEYAVATLRAPGGAGVLALPPATPPTTPPAPPPPTTLPAPPTTPPPTTTPAPPPSTPPPPTPAPVVPEPPDTGIPPVDNAVDPLVDTVNGLLDTIGGLLG